MRGIEIGHAMAEVAATNAGEDWKGSAYDAFCRHALNHQFFTTEEVRAANPNLLAPRDDRAWGAIALQAKRDKVVTSHSWVRANNPAVHGTVVTQWASRIYLK